VFICECGRAFCGSQAFNGHRGHCKAYLGEEKYIKSQEKARSAFVLMKKAADKRANNLNQRKEQALQQWISEKHRCEACGEIMTTLYGTGRFCSKSCSCVRPHSEESKIKASRTLKGKQYRKVSTNIPETIDFSLYSKEARGLLYSGLIKPKHLNYYKVGLVENVDYVKCPYCGLRFLIIEKSHLAQHLKTLEDVKKEFGESVVLVSKKAHLKTNV